jgi:hypothetical protein
MPINNSKDKKILLYKNIGGQMPTFFPPFSGTPMGLIQIHRQHTRKVNKMELQEE